MGTSPTAYIGSMLCQWYWLQMEYQLKVLLLNFKVLNDEGPMALRDHLPWYVCQRTTSDGNPWLKESPAASSQSQGLFSAGTDMVKLSAKSHLGSAGLIAGIFHQA